MRQRRLELSARKKKSTTRSRSAALLLRQIRPSSMKRVKAGHRFSM
jgi:hypothetical protein